MSDDNNTAEDPTKMVQLSDLSVLLENQMADHLRDLPFEERQALMDERKQMTDRLCLWVDRFIDIEVSLRRRGGRRPKPRQQQAAEPGLEAEQLDQLFGPPPKPAVPMRR